MYMCVCMCVSRVCDAIYADFPFNSGLSYEDLYLKQISDPYFQTFGRHVRVCMYVCMCISCVWLIHEDFFFNFGLSYEDLHLKQISDPYVQAFGHQVCVCMYVYVYVYVCVSRRCVCDSTMGVSYVCMYM
jgi:hypothetical protein